MINKNTKIIHSKTLGNHISRKSKRFVLSFCKCFYKTGNVEFLDLQKNLTIS